MHTYARKPVSSVSEGAGPQGASSRFAGPTAEAQRILQGVANSSPKVAQLRALQTSLQARFGASPRVLAAWDYGARRESVVQRQDRGDGGNTDVVQRRVMINHQNVPSIVDLLYKNDLGELISTEASEAAGWMLGLSNTWNFGDAEEVLLYTEKVYSMAKLIRSIFANGILSRHRLVQRNIGFVGSADAGNEGGLAVNVLDNRGGVISPEAIADESMTAEDRGSISVALERQNDWIQKDDEWKTQQNVPWTEQDEEQLGRKAQGIPPDYIDEFRRKITRDIAFEQNQRLLNTLYNPEMTDRAQNTVMTIMRSPSASVATRNPGDGSYESQVPEGKIPAGESGFKTLLIPRWFEPFYLMLGARQPHGVEVRFVGDRTVTAFYKSSLGQIPVTVNAPAYAHEVARELQLFQTIATHILTA